MSITLSQRSLTRLETVHPDLVRVVKRAAAMSSLDFTVLEGVRTLDRQAQLVKSGASKTNNSRHLPHPSDGKSRAVDLGAMIGGEVRWDWPLYHKLADTMEAAAKVEGVAIEAGARWKKFPDGPHYQLPWKAYP